MELRKFSHSLARIYNALLFNAAADLIKKAPKKHISQIDIPELPHKLRGYFPYRKSLKLNLDTPFGFLGSLYWHFKKAIVALFLVVLVRASLSLAIPPILQHMLRAIREAAEGKGSAQDASIYAVTFALLSPVAGILLQHYYYNAISLSQKIAVTFSQTLYQHTLSIRFAHTHQTNTGDIINHMSTDTEIISDGVISITEFTMYALVLAGSLAMLFHLAGTAALAGIFVFSILVPLSKVFAKRFTTYDTQLMDAFDKRTTFFSQILNSIRVVKYFGWTSAVENQVSKMRDIELNARGKYALTHALGNLLFMSASVFGGVSIFATIYWQRGSIAPETLFSIIATMGILLEPLRYMSFFISDFINLKVSSTRLQKFLSIPGKEPSASEFTEPGQAFGLSARDLSVHYPNATHPSLRNVAFSVAPGTAVAIVGDVGSGKSTLLNAILGEFPESFVQSHSISFSNIGSQQTPRMAYVPQEPFTLNASLRENILFGESSADISNALELACLIPDMEAMPNGVDTEIGEHGVNLSGGQKQRLALARAIVRKPGMVLLDDPFSALDPKTEHEISKNLIFGYWNKITRIIVTHRLTHLSSFDNIIFLENGKVAAQGSFQELLASSARFQEFIRITQLEKAHNTTSAQTLPLETSATSPTIVRITDEEDRAHGAVRASIYWNFLKAFGGNKQNSVIPILALLISLIILATIAPLIQNAWMANWVGSKSTQFSGWVGLGIYAGLGIFVLITAFAKEIFARSRSLAAGKTIHDEALRGVLYAPMRFFDATPSGRILNRFSRDQFSIESQLSWRFLEFIASVTQLLITCLLIVLFIPSLTWFLFPIFALYYWMQLQYRPAARDTKRLDSIARSPRYAHYKETLAGLGVIRAFGQTQFFIQGFDSKLNTSVRMLFGAMLVNRWFSIRMPILSGAISMLTALSIVHLSQQNLILPAIGGLLLTYTLDFSSVLNWTVRSFSDVEARLTSVERLQHYAHIAPEPEVTLKPALAEQTPWPTAGRIEFKNVTARYASHLPKVLKNISFEIPGGERAGVLGRTGSGKSTLLQVLLRIIPVEQGEVTIDGVNIASIPLNRLRKSIAIIPQFPTLFVGSLRKNLDFLENSTDSEIWEALERVRLAQFVRNLPQQLQTPLAENGGNLSVGQKQLLCLARAFLNKSQIIVMDEATASVDVETDTLIQKAIREQCKNLTVITIAHRLSTIADFSIKIALEDGRIVRFDA